MARRWSTGRDDRVRFVARLAVVAGETRGQRTRGERADGARRNPGQVNADARGVRPDRV